MKLARTALALALAMAAISCAAKPSTAPPATPFELPAAWTGLASTRGGRIGHEWWRELGDPRLDAVVEEALAHNFDLQAAAARLEQAQGVARIEGADQYPQISATIDRTRSKRNFIGFTVPGSTTSTIWSVSLDVSWEIDLWGRLRARKRAATNDLEAASADLSAAQLSVAGQTAKAWFAAVAARELLHLAEETERSFATTAEQVRARYERGVRTALDLRRALAERDNARALVATRRRELDAALRQLEILLGRYPAASIEPSGPLPKPAELPATGLPAELLSRRPDLLAAERRVAAAGARVQAARAAIFPRLALVGSKGRVGEEIGGLLDPSLGVWSIATNLVQPLIDGGRLRGEYERQRAREKEALAAYFAAVLEAYRETESLLAAETQLEARERELTARMTQADAARRLAERRYLNGLEDYIAVLDAQRSALAAATDLVAVRRVRLENRIDLFIALGGGASEPPASLADLEDSHARMRDPS